MRIELSYRLHWLHLNRLIFISKASRYFDYVREIDLSWKAAILSFFNGAFARMKHVFKCGTFLFLFICFGISLSSLCILSVKRQSTGRNTKESSAFSERAGSTSSWGAETQSSYHEELLCVQPVDQCEDFSLRGLWNNYHRHSEEALISNGSCTPE